MSHHSSVITIHRKQLILLSSYIQTGHPSVPGNNFLDNLTLMGGLVEGAATEAAFGVIFKSLIQTTLRVALFPEKVNRLQSTIRRIKLRIDEDERSDQISKRTQHEIQVLNDLLLDGDKLLRKCAKVKRWNVFKRWYYSIKLTKLELALLSFFQLDMAALLFQNNNRILRKLSQLEKRNNRSTTDIAKVQLHTKPDLGSHIVLRRKKQLNLVVLLPATATWILMEFYQYSFITLFSWLLMAVVICCFFWGTIHRLLKKEDLDLSELEISEEKMMDAAQMLRQRAEDGIRLMFHVSAEREWFVFGGVVAALFLTSVVATHLDFLTVCYIGLLGGLNIPLLYAKYESRIREAGENLRIKVERLYDMIGDKLRKMNLIKGSQKTAKKPLKKKKKKKKSQETEG